MFIFSVIYGYKVNTIEQMSQGHLQFSWELRIQPAK